MRDYAQIAKDLRLCSKTGDIHRDAVEVVAAETFEELVAMQNVMKSRLAQLEKAEYESGDCAETYKNGFLIGKRQGAIELLREILDIDVDEPPKESP